MYASHTMSATRKMLAGAMGEIGWSMLEESPDLRRAHYRTATDLCDAIEMLLRNTDGGSLSDLGGPGEVMDCVKRIRKWVEAPANTSKTERVIIAAREVRRLFHEEDSAGYALRLYGVFEALDALDEVET